MAAPGPNCNGRDRRDGGQGPGIWGPARFRGGFHLCRRASARAGFAAVSVDTGLLSGLWDHAFSNGTVQGLGTDGTYLYVGGDFTSADGVSTINGNPVHGLVRFDR